MENWHRFTAWQRLSSAHVYVCMCVYVHRAAPETRKKKEKGEEQQERKNVKCVLFC